MQVLYNGMLENNCSEQASRMAAMESSTKNAKEMLAKLTLSYNRCALAATCKASMMRLLTTRCQVYLRMSWGAVKYTWQCW